MSRSTTEFYIYIARECHKHELSARVFLARMHEGLRASFCDMSEKRHIQNLGVLGCSGGWRGDVGVGNASITTPYFNQLNLAVSSVLMLLAAGAGAIGVKCWRKEGKG